MAELMGRSWPVAVTHRSTVGAGDIYVWQIDQASPAGTIENLKAILSDSERARAAKFKFDMHRHQYIVAHSALRTILAEFLLCEPHRLEFIEGPHGKPGLAIAGGPMRLRFNLSHSHNMALIAITSGKELGIDIEYIKPQFDWQSIIQNFFAPGEVKKLKSLPLELQRKAFFSVWTRKESYIKAIGGGLSIPLDSFEVSVDPAEPALLSCTNDPKEMQRWSMANLDVGAEYAATICVEAPIASLHSQAWDFECGRE